MHTSLSICTPQMASTGGQLAFLLGRNIHAITMLSRPYGIPIGVELGNMWLPLLYCVFFSEKERERKIAVKVIWNT